MVSAGKGLQRHDCGVYHAGRHGEPNQAEIGLRVSCRVKQEDAQLKTGAQQPWSYRCSFLREHAAIVAFIDETLWCGPALSTRSWHP